MDNYDLNNYQNDNQDPRNNKNQNNSGNPNNNQSPYNGQNSNQNPNINNGQNPYNNGYQQNPQNNWQQPYNNYQNNNYNQPKPHDTLALLSMIFGIACLVTFCVYYVSIVCGVTSLVLAILSRNRNGRFEGKSIAGLCTAISGLCLMLLFYIMLINMMNSPEMSQYMQQFYGSIH